MVAWLCLTKGVLNNLALGLPDQVECDVRTNKPGVQTKAVGLCYDTHVAFNIARTTIRGVTSVIVGCMRVPFRSWA